MLGIKETQRIDFTDTTNNSNNLLRIGYEGLLPNGDESAIAVIFSFSLGWPSTEWNYLNELIQSYINREGLSTYTEAGITFPWEAEEWENQEGVVLYTPISRVEMSEEAFDYLARKYFRAVYNMAVIHKDAYLETPAGIQFTQFVKELPES